MSRTTALRPYALIALAAVVLGIVENSLFGSDKAGTTAHDVSVGFFFLAVVGIVALVALGVVALIRRTGTRTATR